MLEATTAVPSSAPSPELVAALEHGLVLQQILLKEFDALREQNLDIFEALQPEKTQIFDALIRLTGVGTESNHLEEPEWDTFKNLITDCRDMHRRNEILSAASLTPYVARCKPSMAVRPLPQSKSTTASAAWHARALVVVTKKSRYSYPFSSPGFIPCSQ